MFKCFYDFVPKQNQKNHVKILLSFSYIFSLVLYLQYINHIRFISSFSKFSFFNNSIPIYNAKIFDILKYKADFSTCFRKPLQLTTNINNISNFDHFSQMKYARCILDHDIEASKNESKSGLLLIVDSLCPLGIEVTHQLRENGIDHLDIRGENHLNLNSNSGRLILSQFNISKALILCDTFQTQNFKENYKETFVISVIKTIKSDLVIDIPPVFGHFRGRKSEKEEENLFFQCLTKQKVTKKENHKEYVLAKEAAKSIIEIVIFNKQRKFSFKNYSYNELFERFEKHCFHNKKDFLVESLLESCKPFPPQDGKTITLSMMMTISLDKKYTIRGNQTFYYIEKYLSNFPQFLPFEIVIVAIDKDDLHIENFLTIGPNIKKYIKIIRINQDVYNKILMNLNTYLFPEFVLRNVGVRRCKGEFILSISIDSLPNRALFDFVLHRQFNLNSYFRMVRLDANSNLFSIENDMSWQSFSQYFVKETTTRALNIQVVSVACGSFQLFHWRIWKIIHGFIERKELLHIDTYLALDVIAAIPSPTLVKIIGYNYHWKHHKMEYNKSVKFNIGKHRIYAIKGFISAETFNRRDNWGLNQIKSLPNTEF